MKSLDDWELKFKTELSNIKASDMNKAGSLLAIIPDRLDWHKFLSNIRAEWQNWWKDLISYPNCLIVLYEGLAFYEYETKTFWPQFANAIEIEPLQTNQQSKINLAFLRAAKTLGLKIHRGEKGTDYVGSAVYYVGIPLSMWDGFLEICEWALWRDDWKELSNEEWAESISKRAQGRQRLKKFLIDNRESATTFIKEILDVRETLTNDTSLTVNDIAQACFIRPEYFNEVPDTAEFLRPKDPDSLFQDRPILIWDDQNSSIKLYLPGIAQDQLPATWCIGEITQNAAFSPDQMILNSVAFNDSLMLKLETNQKTEIKHLKGIKHWGLFDLNNNGKFVQSRSEFMRLRNYVLISKEKIDEITRDGFDEDENPVNETIELSDGTTCFITRLWPVQKSANLSLKFRTGEYSIRFRPEAKIQTRFFAGREERAAFFIRKDNIIISENLPTLCVLVPSGYFSNNKTELNDNFKVYMDKKLVGGKWEYLRKDYVGDKEFYIWKWPKSGPTIKLTKSGKTTSFHELGDYFKGDDLSGDRVFSIETPKFTKEFKVKIVRRQAKIYNCWRNLPGTYLPWFLLCQSSEGMKWDDLILAHDVIAPDLKFSYYKLRKYSEQELLALKGHRWTIAESRAVFKKLPDNNYQLEYCGDPSKLWGLYRCLYNKIDDQQLPIIEIIEKRGMPPYLQMIWKLNLRREIVRYLEKYDVHFTQKLWIH